jgi:hypothetical protein
MMIKLQISTYQVSWSKNCAWKRAMARRIPQAIWLSFTPGFSPVQERLKPETVSTVSHPSPKPLKRF